MSGTNFVLGEWKAICDRCGLQFHASRLKIEWTGLRVCESCFETRHPQDLIRIPRTEKAPPWTRPEAADVEVEVDYTLFGDSCTAAGRLSQADYGTADCMTVGTVSGDLIA